MLDVLPLKVTLAPSITMSLVALSAIRTPQPLGGGASIPEIVLEPTKPELKNPKEMPTCPSR